MLEMPYFLHFYKLSKRILVISFIGLIFFPILWTNIQKNSDARFLESFIKSLGKFPLNLTFENIHYQTFDKKNNIIKMTAPTGYVDNIHSKTMTLMSPDIHLVTADNTPIQVQANKGFFDSTKQKITFQDDVKIIDKIGERYAGTGRVDYNITSGVLEMPSKITAQTPQGYITAGTLSVSKKDKKAYFKNGVHITIQPE